MSALKGNKKNRIKLMFQCSICDPRLRRPSSARTPSYLIGDIGDKHILDNVLALLGEIIGGGLRQEGITWLSYEHSRHLCYIANLDPGALEREYNKSHIFGTFSPIAGRGKH